jgi:glycosyltransferase involved in cell wall biosynthesis
MNTIPFFAVFFGKNNKTVLLSYQLARVVWFYQMIFPLSLLGFLVEPLYLKLISKRYSLVLTESISTKKEMLKFGFKDSMVKVFPIGTGIKPLANIKEKNSSNIILFLGALRPMKRPTDAIKAFEIARDNNSSISLVIAGDKDSRYGKKVERYVQKSRHSRAIKLLGRISYNEKIKLLKKAKIILITSVKEGWGLIATEANSQGTPAIAYNADGLRDSITDQKTGVLVKSGDIKELGNALGLLLLEDSRYRQLSIQALSSSKEFTYEKSYKKFAKLIDSLK